MKKEYDVVMLGSLIKRTDEEDSILNKAIEEGVNWIEVGGILLNHRLSGYFYNNFWVNVFPCWYKRGGYYSCRYYYCIIFRHPLQSFWCLGIISVGNLKR